MRGLSVLIGMSATQYQRNDVIDVEIQRINIHSADSANPITKLKHSKRIDVIAKLLRVTTS
jgi:hypothetical protein